MKKTVIFLTLFLTGTLPFLSAEQDNGRSLVDRLFENDPRLQQLEREYQEGSEGTVSKVPQKSESAPSARNKAPTASIQGTYTGTDQSQPRTKRDRRNPQSDVAAGEQSPSPQSQAYYENDNAAVSWDCDDASYCNYNQGYNPARYGMRFLGSFTVGLEYIHWNICSELHNSGSRTVHESISGSLVQNNASQVGSNPILDLAYFNSVSRKVGTGAVSNCWGNGFKLGGRYQTPCRSWDFGVRWTYMNPEDSRSHNPFGSDEVLVSQLFEGYAPFDTVVLASRTTGVRPTFPTYPKVTYAKDKWELCLNFVDFEISRPLCLCDNLYVRPHMGVKLVVLEEKVKTRFEGEYSIPQNTGSPVVSPISGHAKSDCCYKGAGPRIGLNLQWDLFCGVGCYGNVATAIALGGREATRSVFLDRQSEALSGINAFGNIEEKINLVDETCSQSITDVEVGVSWHESFCRGRYGFRMKLGWEAHFITNINGVNSPDAATNGLVFGASTHF